MEFDLSKPQKLLQQSARDLFARAVPGQARARADGHRHGLASRAVVGRGRTGLARHSSERSRAADWAWASSTWPSWPRKWAGPAFPVRSWARSGPPRSSPRPIPSRKHLEPLATGAAKGAVALLEPDTGWCPSEVQLQGRADGSGFKLTRPQVVRRRCRRGRHDRVRRRGPATAWRCWPCRPRRPASRSRPSPASIRRASCPTSSSQASPSAPTTCWPWATRPHGAGALDARGHAGRGGRHAGRHAVDSGRLGRVRQDAAAVRQGDRLVSGRAAHVRRHAAVDRELALGDLLRGLGAGRRAGRRGPQRVDWPRPTPRTPRARWPIAACRSMAASASPGSTTCSCTTSARRRRKSCSATRPTIAHGWPSWHSTRPSRSDRRIG